MHRKRPADRRVLGPADLGLPLLLILALARPAGAGLTRCGPTDPAHGFPFWYEDSAQVRLALGLDPHDALLCPPISVPNPHAPVRLPANFPASSRYWSASATVTLPDGATMSLHLALDTGFAGGAPKDGERLVYSKILLVGENLAPGDYDVIYPYDFVTVTVPDFSSPQDLYSQEVARVPEQFFWPLDATSKVDPFLVWDPLALPACPAGYVGDGVTPHPVVGGPNGNTLDVIGPSGWASTDLWIVSGKVARLSAHALPKGGLHGAPQTVFLGASDEDATIHYTTDGSDPKVGGPAVQTCAAGAAIAIPVTTTLKFYAKTAAPPDETAVCTEHYAIDTVPPVVACRVPTGTYGTPQSAELVADEACSIYYTTDGSDPTRSSPKYSAPLAIAAEGTTTIKFFGEDAVGNCSAIEAAAITLDFTPPACEATPKGGLYAQAQSVVVTASEPCAIYYTTDGSTPTAASARYVGPIAIDTEGATALRFVAIDAAGHTSPVGAEGYTIDRIAPSVATTPTPGRSKKPHFVRLVASESCTIYYTLDGSAPSTASAVYAAAIPIQETTTITHFAVDEAGNASAPVAETFVVRRGGSGGCTATGGGASPLAASSPAIALVGILLLAGRALRRPPPRPR